MIVCFCERVSADSEMDLLVGKRELMSNVGITSLITYLRGGKQYLHNCKWKRGVMIIRERKNSTAIKVSEEGG